MRERRRKRSVSMLQHHREVHICSNNSRSITGPDGDATIRDLSTFMHRVNTSTGS